MLRSFDVGADQMASLIEEERIDAAQHCFQQLEQLRRQFDEFQILAHSMQNQNVLTIEMQNKEIMSLRRCVEEFQVLERTLFNAGIHYARGHLAFGDLWGEVVPGLRGTDPADNRPLFLAPNQVVGSLDDQRRAHYWEKTQNAEVVARLDKQLRWGRDVQETKFSQTLAFANDAEGNSNIRSREADSEVVSQRAAKRSRVNTDTPNQPYWDVPQAVAPVSDIAAISRSVSSTPLMTTPLFQLESLSEPCLSPTTSTVAQFVSLYPLLDQWSLPLSKAVVTKSSREFVLPPLASFADAHPCTYYLWFSMRMSLYRRLGGAKPFHGRTAATAAQWEIKLYNTKNGERSYSYDEKVFDHSETPCSCGMPPLLPRISYMAPCRADGSPIQSSDFESPALQALLSADLELAHAKLQFEQTDDILLGNQTWSKEQWTRRIEARGIIFRNSWDPSLASVPLEMPDLLSRRSWISSFYELLKYWPGSESMGSLPVDETGRTALEYRDYFASAEQRVITFYLDTVSTTLGMCPARPRQRPAARTLPPSYQHLLS